MKKQEIQIFGQNIVYWQDEDFDIRDAKIVLFIHGFGDSGLRIGSIARYTNRNYKLIAIDLPGCGESRDVTKTITLEYYSQIVTEFIKQKIGQQKFWIVAHSMGAHITLMLSKNFENLQYSLLCAPAIYYNDPAWKTFLKEKVPFFIPQTSERLWYNYTWLLAPSEEKLAQMPHIKNKILQTPQAMLDLTYNLFYKLVNDELTNFDYLQTHIKPLWAQYPYKKVLYAEFDKVLPPEMMEVVLKENKVDNLMVKGAGHAIFYSAPELVNNEINKIIEHER
ncbi:alpha/beta fold hydrolase [Mycoplasmopsis columbinasalis]|uniref:Acetoin dehydrogenase E2 subunit dihydrolipoyllysine-residue acetyltransferase n=1 Tax=Mycoplasmopsis columbinasalis TaxID=114880 RepID=A0A449BAF6_9BACT|nr:alpha/beta hydrolase [Mycoplasmopsis columbinasalis]VEU78149.1 acetoin dehydrogenase E2 subunit dihydrolipoyllysine-residue acetyltransferase [Mycoplasmopsis columbinasalis]